MTPQEKAFCLIGSYCVKHDKKEAIETALVYATSVFSFLNMDTGCEDEKVFWQNVQSELMAIYESLYNT
jgi:hypothetical protein